tara:strand:+ start:50381 stop:50665 length:285 start_codon:yes stop_codon:yes gene_type:complete
MADAPTNRPIAENAIVAKYPELVGLETTLDSVAAAGRLYWYLAVDCVQDTIPIVDHINTVLDAQGYEVKSRSITVNTSSKDLISIFIPPIVVAP